MSSCVKLVMATPGSSRQLQLAIGQAAGDRVGDTRGRLFAVGVEQLAADNRVRTRLDHRATGVGRLNRGVVVDRRDRSG